MAKKKEKLNEPVVAFKNQIPNKEKVLKQYLIEKDYATKSRQVKIGNWMQNEELYNGVTHRTLLTRSNLHVPIVFEGVQNASSKIGMKPDVKFDTIPEGDENAAEIMKHTVMEDLDDSNWDIVYENSKIEAGIYGRTIYEVIPGNDKQEVVMIDSLAYLCSPIAKNTRTALYQGVQFIYKTIEQLEEEANEMEYDTEELKKIRNRKVPSETARDPSSEASAKNLRMANMGLSNQNNYGSKVLELTKWWTYIVKGKKAELYALTVADDMYLIRCKKASELGLKRPPYVSWGTFTRGIAMLAPSIADVYRDPNLAVDVMVNQMIDNNTYRNFGMIFAASSSGLKQSSIVPRPLGVTSVQTAPNESVQSKVWQFTPPDINETPTVINLVKGFADSASGLQPMTQQKGKVSVTQLAKINADLDAKVQVMKRNATLACEELYQLMSDITKDRLTKPRQVKLFGYKNLTLNNVTKKNFEGVKLVAKAVPSEDSQQNKAIKQKAKIDLYTLFKDDPKVPGQLALRRSVAKTFDIDPDELESLFKEEEQQTTNVAAAPPADPNAAPPKPGDKPMSDATALLSQTQKGAQVNVPRAIK